MTKKKKLSKDYLDLVKSYLTEKNIILSNIGSLEVQKNNIVNKLNLLEDEFSTVKKEMQEKYGRIKINPEDGTYEILED